MLITSTLMPAAAPEIGDAHQVPTEPSQVICIKSGEGDKVDFYYKLISAELDTAPTGKTSTQHFDHGCFSMTRHLWVTGSLIRDVVAKHSLQKKAVESLQSMHGVN
jgi:hypothetical protein